MMQGKSFRVLSLFCGSALIATAAFSVEGGVTFTNIANQPGSGITYGRVTSPDREADRAAIVAQSYPIATFGTIPPETPQKWHGAPGIAVFDFDNDGDLDIYVTNGPGANNSLYSNQLTQTGQVSFVDVGAAAGVGLQDHDSSGTCFGDIDNDGDKDLYVLGSGYSNHLFRNNGNSTFTDITPTAGVAGADFFYYSGCSMGDVNNDGLLDIVVGTTYHPWLHRYPVFNLGYIPGQEPDYLFVNTGNNVFVDASQSSGLLNLVGINVPNGESVTWGIAAVDIDQDGDADVMNAEDNGPGINTERGWMRLLRNDGTGQFTDKTVDVGLNVTGGFMGYAYADLNCDGTLDFFVTDTGSYLTPGRPSRWYLQNADGTFRNPGLGGLVGTPFGWGVSALDYDNDGDTDIYYDGDVDMLRIIAADNPGVILRNSGNCTATMTYDRPAIVVDHRPRVVEGVAIGDINNDGFDDLLSVSGFDFTPFNFFQYVPIINPVPRSPVFDPVAAAELAFFNFPSNPTVLVYLDPIINNGTLAVELNSANNGNKSAQFTLVGAKGLVNNPHASGKVNRDGIGGVIRFTPDGGKTAIRPVLGGSSYASQDSLTITKGLGTAAKGTVEVLWPGGVRNRLYDVAAGEKVRLPEIPCDFQNFQPSLPGNGNAGRLGYSKCVKESLKDLTQQNVISQAFASRLEASALRAYDAAH
ncbi:MAG TPA: CRTAC1 family protein [Thermoanaerobaculia bacterium]